jgi:hypothetical protein
MNQQKVPDAIREYEQAAKLQPDLAEAHYHLAQAYARLGENDRAREESALHDRLRKQQQAEEERKKAQAGQLQFSIEGASKR